MIDEEINEQEAANAMRIHFIEGAMVIPLKALRALNSPEYLELLYQDSLLGIRILKNRKENALTIPSEVYSGRWRGVQIEKHSSMDLIYKVIEKKGENCSGNLSFFEKGCVIALNEIMPSEYKINELYYYKLNDPDK